MRLGVHASQQREIIKFIQDTLRGEFWAMVALVLLSVFLGGAFVFWPRIPPEKLAVALVQTPTSSGSGFLVTSELAVTTSRVVGKHSQVFLLFPGEPPVTGRVLFADAEGDVALIQVVETDKALRPLALGDSDAVAEREDLYLVGYPGEMYHITYATLGKRGSGVLETDTISNPGNSGAPLIRKMDDSVVGMILSTRELGGQGDTGRHRAISINKITEISRARQHPIR